MRDWLIDAADLLAQPDPGPTPWLVENLIVDEAIIAAVGRWKVTKSYGLLDVCISIATGRPAFGALAIPNPGPVIFVNEESGKAALWRRLDALCRGRAIDPEELRGRLHVAANSRVKLDDRGWQEELTAIGRDLNPRLYVFDPLARMKAAGLKENEQSAMAVPIEFLRDLREATGAAVAFVHHTGHTGDHMRGSSDLESAWETRLRWKRDGQSPLIEIESEHREAEAGPVVSYRIAWDAETRSMRFNAIETSAPGVPPLAERIVEWLREHPLSKAREVATGIEVRASDVDRQLKRLVADGLILKGRSGRTDRLGREIRDEAYTLAGASSQPLFSDTPGTTHGTSHNGASHTRTTQEEAPAESKQPSGMVARPTDGTTQDEPPTGHLGSVPRPAPLGAGERDEPPAETEPTLDEALHDPDLLHRWITPYAEVLA